MMMMRNDARRKKRVGLGGDAVNSSTILTLKMTVLFVFRNSKN
jgi:hypothetical protein